MICCVITHIQYLKVWLKSVLPRLKYSIFARGLFFVGAPCICSSTCWIGYWSLTLLNVTLLDLSSHSLFCWLEYDRVKTVWDCVSEQGDLVTQLNSRAASGLPVGAALGSKSRLCLIGSSGVTWQTVPAQLPIAVIRQPGEPLSQSSITSCFIWQLAK